MATEDTRDAAFTVDLASDVAIYQQLVDQVRLFVARGILGDGDPLPSVRDLGARVGVNQNTVARAYRVLADEGLVELRHGATARIKNSGPPKRPSVAALVDAEDRRRLDDLFARWKLRGADKKTVERVLADAIARHFPGGGR
ncbi:GntR family transcriptional regulator [Myxococcota bacterium]|nr:GntR family transcriptional regulator [Myxococcota bacterium]